MSRNYTHMKVFEAEMVEMKEAGKTSREIAEHFGIRDKYVVKAFFKRRNATQRKREEGVSPRKKGRPRKREFSTEEEKDYELKQLRMENELLRDFLQLAGRR